MAHLHTCSDIVLVITDLRMSRENRFAMLQYLAENLRFNHIPAIVFTARADNKTVISAAEAGAQEYIVTSTSREVLLDKIRKVLDRCRKTLLLVSDHQATLHVLTRALKNRGFTTLTATSGAKAYNIIKLSNVDIVVTELVLEDMTGFDLMAKVQGIRPGFYF
jgi:DNA-binding response OmpR family regulator